MKSGRLGIFLTGAVTVGALALAVLRPSAVGEVVYPVERVFPLLGRHVGSRISGLFSGASAAAENVRLRRENQSLLLLRATCERLRAENADLRRSLGFKARAPESWVAAAVLSSGGSAAATHRTIRIDKGTLAGVRKNAVAVVPGGLVGRVSAVSEHTAEVTLITDAAVKVSCLVETEGGKRVHGILSGDGTERLSLGFTGDAGRLRARSTVVTSGLGGVFPRDLEIGTLLLTANDVRGGEGEVLPSVDFSTLEDVFIRRDE